MMSNTLNIGGFKAVVNYDPDIDMLRGEFIGLNGGADFYASDIKGLRKEGATSLKVFSESMRATWNRTAQGIFWQIHYPHTPDLHQQAVEAATAAGKSLNQWVGDVLNAAVSS